MRYPRVGGRTRTRADLVALLVLLVSGLIVSTLDPGMRMGIARGMRETVLWPFLRLHEAFAERTGLAVTVTELRAERDSLVEEVVRLRQLAAEGAQLRRVVELGELPETAYLASDLVPGRPRVGDSDVFMLRAPGLARIEPPVGVFTGDGLVGVVRSAVRNTATGDFWTHPDFRVSVRTEDGATTGIVRSVEEEGGQPVMLLEGAPYQEEIPPGTRLVTTGLAGIYPAGIRVGTVESVARVESGWARSYLVRPAVRPEEVDVVLVWRRAAGGPGDSVATDGPEPMEASPDGTAAGR